MGRVPEKAWKRAERRVAEALGGERTPLSGGASKHTRGDIIHPDLYVEVKRRKDSKMYEDLQSLGQRARRYGRAPLIVQDCLEGNHVEARWYVTWLGVWKKYHDIASLDALPAWEQRDLLDNFLVEHEPRRGYWLQSIVEDAVRCAHAEEKVPLVAVVEHRRNKVLAVVPETV